MSILPSFLQPLLDAYLQPLLRWFSDRVYADLLKQAPDDFLLKLQRRLDCAPLEKACAGYHHASGPGTTPTHPVARLVRATLVGALYDWSLRELEHQIRFNLVVKWFVGYALYEAGPDHCTLERFELWVCEHQHRAYFDDVLRQIDIAFPEDRRAVQLGDTFAVRAHAARENLGRLIRHTCQCALHALQTVAPDLQPEIDAQLQIPALFGAANDPHAFRLSPAERARRLQTTVEAAQACARWVQTSLGTRSGLSPVARSAVTIWLQRLEKIWADELTFTSAPTPPAPAAVPTPAPETEPGLSPTSTTAPVTSPIQGAELGVLPVPAPHPVAPTLPDSEPDVPPVAGALPASPRPVITAATTKGSYRLGSATDPEATYRVHGPGAEKTEFGYNPQLLTTADFIREIQAHTGACPDGTTLAPALQAQHDHHGLCPAKVIYDSAAGSGKVHAQVAAVTQGCTQLVAPLVAYDKRTDRFTPDTFTLSPDGQILTCPQGRSTDIAYRHGLDEGRTFRFLGHVCHDCPLWEQCRAQKAGSTAARQVFISDYRPEVEAARAYAQTDGFKTDMRQRPIVERIIAALVRYNGARRARRRGLLKTDFQMKMCATAYNLKKWMRLLDQPVAAGPIPRPG